MASPMRSKILNKNNTKPFLAYVPEWNMFSVANQSAPKFCKFGFGSLSLSSAMCICI